MSTGICSLEAGQRGDIDGDTVIAGIGTVATGNFALVCQEMPSWMPFSPGNHILDR